MAILIVSQYFWPESFRINVLVRSWIEKGEIVALEAGICGPTGLLMDQCRFGEIKTINPGIAVPEIPTRIAGRLSSTSGQA